MDSGQKGVQDARSNYGTTAAPREINGDSFTGQIGHLDELINMARTALDRITSTANVMAPSEPPSTDNAKVVGRIDQSPDAGPMIYRIQNRTAELHRLLHSIAMQQNRIDQVL